jgi:hypothetical protein
MSGTFAVLIFFYKVLLKRIPMSSFVEKNGVISENSVIFGDVLRHDRESEERLKEDAALAERNFFSWHVNRISGTFVTRYKAKGFTFSQVPKN